MKYSSSRVGSGQARAVTELGSNLTARQRFVLRGLIAGRTNQEIAEELCLTEHTIKYHCRALYQHFNVGNRVELISQLLQRFGNDLVHFARHCESGSASACHSTVAERRPTAYIRGPEVRRFSGHELYRQQRL